MIINVFSKSFNILDVPKSLIKILNAQKSFYKWEVSILTDDSLKSAYHFSCGHVPRLPFSIYWRIFGVWYTTIRLVQAVYK